MEENKNPEPEEQPAEHIPELIHPPGETDIPVTEELQTTNHKLKKWKYTNTHIM